MAWSHTTFQLFQKQFYIIPHENLEGMFKTRLAQGIKPLGPDEAFCLLL